MNALLEVSDLRTCFTTDDGEFAAVDGVSFEVHAGKTLAIVGESGCGKSVTSLSIMGLVSAPAGAIRAGSIRFEGQELVGASDETLQNLRGNGMAMGFQEPMTSLNPAYTVGEIEQIVTTEYVVHLSDLVCRRSIIALLGDARPEVLRELADIVGAVLGWDQARKDQEITSSTSRR